MGKVALITCCTLAWVSSAQAGAVVRLEADMDAPNSDGTYNGGEQFSVDVWVTSSATLGVRLLQFDHTASSLELTLGADLDNGNPVYEPTVENPFDGVANFLFDYRLAGSSEVPASYSDFSNLKSGVSRTAWPASTVYTDLSGSGDGMLTIRAGVPFHAGVMPVTLPQAAGTYTLDLLNETAGDANLGALIMFGGLDGTPTSEWSSIDDGSKEIAYSTASGPLELTVIPEPATVLLFAAGGIAVFRRRRNS
ncbi:MAG: PEP-CTERM sorting domain-containing protein [Phycisphaerales bacterium]|nr:MAG: PEP-CTERM sorting domain-containing protein [Phycisphaerales bacterium]